MYGVCLASWLKGRRIFHCKALVSLYGLKNDECYMCSAPVSPQGFKRDVYFIVARLFRLMA